MPADIKSILKIEVSVSVEIASRPMSMDDVLGLAPGAIIELPKHVDDPLELVAGRKTIGQGRAVKVGENFGLRVSKIGDVRERINALAG